MISSNMTRHSFMQHRAIAVFLFQTPSLGTIGRLHKHILQICTRKQLLYERTCWTDAANGDQNSIRQNVWKMDKEMLSVNVKDGNSSTVAILYLIKSSTYVGICMRTRISHFFSFGFQLKIKCKKSWAFFMDHIHISLHHAMQRCHSWPPKLRLFYLWTESIASWPTPILDFDFSHAKFKFQISIKLLYRWHRLMELNVPGTLATCTCTCWYRQQHHLSRTNPKCALSISFSFFRFKSEKCGYK